MKPSRRTSVADDARRDSTNLLFPVSTPPLTGDTSVAQKGHRLEVPSFPQRFINGEIHEWYRINLGYSDQTVGWLMDHLGVSPGHKILDPFCGTGTTLVEAMKRRVSSVGIDANPSSLFAARVKTNWTLRPGRLLELLLEIERSVETHMRPEVSYDDDPTYKYLFSSGMIQRHWISAEPLRHSLALKTCIRRLSTSRPYRNALMLALLTEVVHGASNVRFGPELYCGPPRDNVDVVKGFARRVQLMARDLALVLDGPSNTATLISGDSRNVNRLLRGHKIGRFDAVVCSPPYPTEHDYTRNSRLELAFLEAVTDLESLRVCKKSMIRSHTKGIYRDDCDASLVDDDIQVQALADEIARKMKGKTYGFARFYPVVIREYFGGMTRHLRSMKAVLKPGAQCAYVVGDQACYASVHIPTATILARIAARIGYEASVEEWRTRRSSTTANDIRENVLFLRKPK